MVSLLQVDILTQPPSMVYILLHTAYADPLYGVLCKHRSLGFIMINKVSHRRECSDCYFFSMLLIDWRDLQDYGILGQCVKVSPKQPEDC